MVRTALFLLCLLLATPAFPAPDAERLDAAEGLPAARLESPPGGGKDRPLIVALPEMGAAPEEVLARLGAAVTKAGYSLLVPAPAGLGTKSEDFDGIVARARAVRDRLGASSVHLVGFEDAGIQAVSLAFAHSRLFRSLVVVGADLPAVDDRASRLRVLDMKGEKDRPEAGRESVRRLASKVEAVDFHPLPGDGRELSADSLAYLTWFLDVASDRIEAGVDRSLTWRQGARGLAERKAAGRAALVYLFDAGKPFASRTREIQADTLFSPELKDAAEGAVAVLAPRDSAGKLLPDLDLAPGPALVVLGRAGQVLLATQHHFPVKELAAALTSGR